MDVLLIGKKTFAHSEAPVIVYCGSNREEAFKAAAATAGKFPFMYFVDPTPFQRVSSPEAPAPVAKTEAPGKDAPPAPPAPPAEPSVPTSGAAEPVKKPTKSK